MHNLAVTVSSMSTLSDILRCFTCRSYFVVSSVCYGRTNALNVLEPNVL